MNDDALNREALPSDECVAVAGDFFRIIRWQTSGPTSSFMSSRLVTGDLAIDADENDGAMLSAMLRNLWLPVRIPRRGRRR